MKKLLLIKLILFSIIINLGFIAYAQPGSIDNSFNTGNTFNSGLRVKNCAIQNDGKIIVGTTGTNSSFIRLNIDGSIDTTFNSGAQFDCYTLSIQSDGKTIVGGTYSTVLDATILRLNTDGSIDNTFNVGTIDNNPNILSAVVRASAIQSDGKIIIGGFFTFINGIARNGIARLNPDGSIDNTFDPGTGIEGGYNGTSVAESLVLQDDGKIIIGGQFTSYNGITRDGIVRLNTDGSLDTNFDTGIGIGGYNGNHSVSTSHIQSNGKIIIGGPFSSYYGIARNSIARLNTDGSLDTSFDTGIGTTGGISPNVFSISVQNNEKIIITGGFKFFNGISRSGIARLNPDGTLDSTFNPGTGAEYANNSNYGYINTSIIQNDGKIIISGQFTSYNGNNRNFIARINGGDILNNNVFVNSALIIFPNPVKNFLNIQTPNDSPVTSCRIVDVLGKIIIEQNQNNNTINTETLSKGIYILEVYSGNEKFTNKFVKE
jgi:uncharacterized delta-60 repeat protein